MKRILLALALLTFLLPEARAQAGAVVYSLPRTTIHIQVEARREAFTAGPYAAYAQKYLGVAARTQNATTYTLESVTLTPYVEADPATRYSVSIPEKSTVGFLQLCSQGLIALSDNYAVRSASWNAAPQAGTERFEGLDPLGNLGKQTTTLYKAVLKEEGYERVPVTQESVVEKSPDRKAADAADVIFSLREKRQQIATGDTDATFSGEALQSAIDEITRLEARYLSLFYGITDVSQEIKSFDITPDPKSADQRYTAFRLSDQGLLPATATGGKAITLELQAEPLAAPEAASDRSKEALIHYRVPAVTRCRLIQDGKALLENRILVYQLGEESTLPINAILTR